MEGSCASMGECGVGDGASRERTGPESLHGHADAGVEYRT
eukprot:IDg23848t1